MEKENRLYQCESCKKYECATLLIPTQCRCGGRVVELERDASLIASPTSRPNLSDKERRRLFEYHGGICHISNRKIDPVRDDWEIEHVIPRWAGGKDTDDNMRPALQEFHKEKTAKEATERAKGNRIQNKHGGFHRPKTKKNWGRSSKYKKKVNGDTVLRQSS